MAAPVLFRHPSVWGSPNSFAWLLPLSTAVALGRRSALRPSVVPPLGRVRPRSIRSLAAPVLHRSGPRMLWSPVAPFFGCSVAYCRSGARIGPVPALGPISCRSLWSSIILLGRFCARAFDFRVFVFHLCLLTCVLVQQLGVYVCVVCFLTRVFVSLLCSHVFHFRRSFLQVLDIRFDARQQI